MSKRAIDRWNRLKTVESGDGFLEVSSIDSGIATGFGTVRYAIGPEGQPRLLVPILRAIPANELASTSKLSLTNSNYNISNKPTSFIDIMCTDGSLDVVFGELAEEILRRIVEGVQPLKSVTDSIADFRDLLRENSSDEISENRILGLIGELHILRQLVSYNPCGLQAWTGPFEHRHDFRRGASAAEVKTSARADSTRITIHGIDQLAAPTGGTLHLVHIKMEPVPQGQLSVGRLFEDLITNGADRKILMQGLAAVGCLNPHSGEWNSHHYDISGLHVYNVVDGFPRIVVTSFHGLHLPQGISDLEYQVDLQHANFLEISAEDFEVVFQRIAG